MKLNLDEEDIVLTVVKKCTLRDLKFLEHVAKQSEKTKYFVYFRAPDPTIIIVISEYKEEIQFQDHGAY